MLDKTPDDYGLVGMLAKLAAFGRVADAGTQFQDATLTVSRLREYARRFNDTGLIEPELLKCELHGHLAIKHLVLAQIPTNTETEYGLDVTMAKDLAELLSDMDEVIADLEKEVGELPDVEDH
jgi:hypothetical protein